MEQTLVQGQAESTSSKGRWLGVIIAVLVLAAGGAAVLGWRAMGTSGGGEGAATDTSKRPASTAKLDAILNAAESCRRTGENGKAEAILKQAIVEHPSEQRLYILYAEVLSADARLDEAYSNYEKALAIGPREGEVEFAAGTLANMRGRFDRAIEHYSAAQTANPSDYRVPLFLGQVQLKMERIDEAKKSLLLSAKLKPDIPVTWGTLADIALRENKPSIALTHIAKAREIDPQATMWRVIEARAHKREGNPEKALTLLIGLDVNQRREPGVLPLMAECFGMLGKPAEAAAIYTQAADQDQARGELAYEAALWLERAGEKEKAGPYARRAADLQVKGAAELAARLGA